MIWRGASSEIPIVDMGDCMIIQNHLLRQWHLANTVKHKRPS